MELDLKAIRSQLDDVDDQMIPLFARRMALVARVAEYKKEKGLPILDTGREEAILDKIGAAAGEEMAPYARELYRQIFRLSREYQAACIEGMD